MIIVNSNVTVPAVFACYTLLQDDKIITYVGTFSFHFGHKFFFWKRSNRREGLLATASGLPKSHPWPLTCVRLILTFAFLNNKDKDKDKDKDKVKAKVKVPPLNSYVGPPHLNLCILKQFKAPWVRSYRHTLLGHYEVESPEAFWTFFFTQRIPEHPFFFTFEKVSKSNNLGRGMPIWATFSLLSLCQNQ